MYATTDFTGLSALVAAIAAGVVSVIGALAALQAKKNTATTNGKTLGQFVEQNDPRAEDTNAKVTKIAEAAQPLIVPPLAKPE